MSEAHRRPRRGLVPRDEGTYSNLKHGKPLFSANKMPAGHLILNTQLDVNVQLFLPQRRGDETMFRPFPPLSPSHPTEMLMPGRLSQQPGDYSQCWVSCPCACFVGMKSQGCEQLSWALCHPNELREAYTANPYLIMTKKARAVSRNEAQYADGSGWDVAWNKLLPELGGKKGSSSEMPMMQQVWFFQGAVFQGAVYDFDTQEAILHDFMGDRELPFGLAPGDPLPIIQASGKAGGDLCKLLDKLKAEFDDSDKDYSAPYFYGDPVGTFDRDKGTVSGGLILGLYTPQSSDDIEPHSTYDGDYQGRAQAYAFRLHKKYQSGRNTYPAHLDAKMVDQVFAKAQFFFPREPGARDGLIDIAPVEQQAGYVARCFAKEPRLVKLSWLEHREFMTDEVQGILNARKTFTGPGNYVADEDRPPDDRSHQPARADDTRRRDNLDVEPRRSRLHPPQRDVRDVAQTTSSARSQHDEFADNDRPTGPARPPSAAANDDFDEDQGFDNAPPAARDGGRRARTAPNLHGGRTASDAFDEESDIAEDEAPASQARAAGAAAPDDMDAPHLPARPRQSNDDFDEAPQEAPRSQRRASDEKLFDFDTRGTRTGRTAASTPSNEPVDNGAVNPKETEMAKSIKAAQTRSGRRSTASEEAPVEPPPAPTQKRRGGRPKKES